jgi:putative SOS response-associated peptidase YedK
MCGRFTLTTPAELIAEAFGLDELPQLSARYNVAPSQHVAAVRQVGERRQLSLLRWGFSGARHVEGDLEERAGLLINARSETAARRPAFREALQKRRCLLPADGFYEWSGAPGRRQAHHIRLREKGVFGLAGLFEPLSETAGVLGACVILTSEPNDLVRPIHDRMPVIVRPEDYARWLDPRFSDPKGLQHVFAPYPAWAMLAERVGSAVNDVARDGPECLAPARQRSLFEL